MPKTIPCWDCKGKGNILHPDYPEKQSSIVAINCPTCNGGGVLLVYTQSEYNKLKAENKKLKTLIHDLPYASNPEILRSWIAEAFKESE